MVVFTHRQRLIRSLEFVITKLNLNEYWHFVLGTECSICWHVVFSGLIQQIQTKTQQVDNNTAWSDSFLVEVKRSEMAVCGIDHDSVGSYRVTAPLSASMKAAVGLAERTSCWTCFMRGCFCSAVSPVNTTVLAIPDIQPGTRREYEFQEKLEYFTDNTQLRLCIHRREWMPQWNTLRVIYWHCCCCVVQTSRTCHWFYFKNDY